MAFVILLDDLRWQEVGSRAELELRSRANALSGPQQDPPSPGRRGFKEENFDLAGAPEFPSAKSGWDDAGVVADDEVPGPEGIGEVGECGGIPGDRLPVEDHEPGVRSGRRGLLGDAFGGQ